MINSYTDIMAYLGIAIITTLFNLILIGITIYSVIRFYKLLKEILK